MYWSPNFLAVVFKKQEISRPRELTNKRSSHQNAGFSIWVFKNFLGVIPRILTSGRERPLPHPTPSPNFGRALGSSAPVLGLKSWSSPTFQPWLRLASLGSGANFRYRKLNNLHRPTWQSVSPAVPYMHVLNVRKSPLHLQISVGRCTPTLGSIPRSGIRLRGGHK